MFPKAGKQLFQIAEGDFLTLGDFSQRHGPARRRANAAVLPVLGQIGHRHHGISSLGRQSHRRPSKITRIPGLLC
jgi:hypothetical protein